MDEAMLQEHAECRRLLGAERYDEAATLLGRLSQQLLFAGAVRNLLDMFERLPDDVRETDARLLLTVGDAYNSDDDARQAVTCYEQAQRLAQVNGDCATEGSRCASKPISYGYAGT
ncbi:MAG: hypothetical protein HC828_08430 [Blastochloris sp.]|nr:hypothetical protein [Blastochloris sp.]